MLLAGLVVPVGAAAMLVTVGLIASGIEPSRVLFRQARAGRHGVPFTILKFRTLRRDPDGRLVATRFGAFLRRTKLDEIPQMWNVLRGDMSLIGPRPETLSVERWAAEHVPGFPGRLRMRPGITGLAQVEQDSTTQEVRAYREKLWWNELYARRIGLGMDLWILGRTALRPLRPRRETGRASRAAGLKTGPSERRSLEIG